MNLKYILSNLNIVDIAQKILPGRFPNRPISKNPRGICPFHLEMTPSLVLHHDWNLYLCYGCLSSGGPLSFPFDLSNNPDGVIMNDRKKEIEEMEKRLDSDFPHYTLMTSPRPKGRGIILGRVSFFGIPQFSSALNP